MNFCLKLCTFYCVHSVILWLCGGINSILAELSAWHSINLKYRRFSCLVNSKKWFELLKFISRNEHYWNHCSDKIKVLLNCLCAKKCFDCLLIVQNLLREYAKSICMNIWHALHDPQVIYHAPQTKHKEHIMFRSVFVLAWSPLNNSFWVIVDWSAGDSLVSGGNLQRV
jgi:hypothetical protein